MALFGVGIPPRDHEDLVPHLEQVLDDAPPRREVERVVLVDRRRNDHKRTLVHARGLRLVLDQLEDLVVHDDRPLRDGEVAAH